VSELHDLVRVEEMPSGVQEVCQKCHERLFFRKEADSGRLEPAYTKAHRYETLQPWENLYYRYHPEKMQVTTKRHVLL
jgi:hypothetical protein